MTTTLQIRLQEIERMFDNTKTIKRTFAELQVGDIVLTNENGVECEFKIQSVSKSRRSTLAKGILSDGYNETYATMEFTGLVTCLKEEAMKA